MQNSPTPDTHAVNAFVHMIESPAPDDLFDGRTEGRMLWEALRLAGIRTWYRLAATVATFDRALQAELVSAITYYRALPILHISAHGKEEGVGLTDGSFLTWQQLHDRLVPLNRALGGALILCMSSCFDARGCRMAMRENESLPFHAMVGHFGSPTWSDAAVAFVAFYHRLFKGAGVDMSIAAMRQASGDAGFLIQYGPQIQQGWTQFMQQRRFEELLRFLQPAPPAPGQAPGPEADAGR